MGIVMGIAWHGNVIRNGNNLVVQGRAIEGAAVAGARIFRPWVPPEWSFFNQLPQWGFRNDGPYSLGFKFSSTVAGTVIAVRQYVPSVQVQQITFGLWNVSGTQRFLTTSASGTGWVTAAANVPIVAGTQYWAGWYGTGTEYSVGWTSSVWTPAPLVSGPLTLHTFGWMSGFNAAPTNEYAVEWYGNDIVFREAA